MRKMAGFAQFLRTSNEKGRREAGLSVDSDQR
jgi:hypothetical protein